MVKDHSDSEKETCCRHIGYSYRLTARVLLYAPSHRQDNTYLCYTSHGALAGTRNSSMGPPHEGSIQRPIAPKTVRILIFTLDVVYPVTTRPTLHGRVRLTGSGGEGFTADSADNGTAFWTNLDNPTSVHYNLSAQSSIPSPGQLPVRPAYIEAFRVGIVMASFNFKLSRGNHCLPLFMYTNTTLPLDSIITIL